MVAVARHQEAAGAQHPNRSPIPDHLLQPKKSPIAQRLAAEEAARIERSRDAARRRTTVRTNLRLVDGRPLIETARPAGRWSENAGMIDYYARRTHGRMKYRPNPTALIAEPVRIGRGTRDHYRTIHAGSRPTFRRMRIGSLGHGWRLSLPGRMAIASLAALVVVLGAFGAGFAQQRYEVREGDTVQSIADTFGVDPAAIVASSWMPNGETLAAGQVVVIPDVGQSPAEAAQVAAAQEGTSPWVVAAWWVEAGDTLSSIGTLYGVTAQQLAEFNAIPDVANLQVGTRILIPVSRDQTGAIAAVERGPDVIVPGVSFYQQSRNLSCEFAAMYIATAAFGSGIPEDVFISQVPLTLNPHNGYRGNIDGAWGNTDDYGIYPEALLPVLNQQGFAGEVFYSLGDTSSLVAHIDAGHPVVVWLGLWGDTRVRLSDEGDYSVAAGMHVMTVYGYDEEGVYLSDPATASSVFYTWDAFVAIWSVLDGMTMAVYPA